MLRKFSNNGAEKGKRRMAVAIALLAVMVVAAITGGLSARNNDRDAMNRRADVLKARRMAETASMLAENNVLAAKQLYDAARMLAPGDTVTTLDANNFELRLSPNRNPLYYTQLQLLEATPDAPANYYFTLTRVQPPESESGDSVPLFTTALKAYERFPDNDIFIDNLLRTGVQFLYSQRYNTDRSGNITDTLELSENSVAFANGLLARADTIEQLRGYSYAVDHSRAAVYSLLERYDDLRELASRLEERDSTDIQILDLLTTAAYITGDSLRVSELGIRRFEIEPDGSHVYSLYSAIGNDTLRNRFVDAVFHKALDTDLEPDMRLALLNSLAQAFYDDRTDLPDSVPLLARVSDAVSEITAEDPLFEKNYLVGTMLVRNRHWVKNYGYRHWMEAVDAIPDTAGNQTVTATVITADIPVNPEFEKRLASLVAFHKTDRPDLELTAQSALAQYYFNTKQYRKALDIMLPVTLDAIHESSRFGREYDREHGNPDTRNEVDVENEDLQRWLLFQSLVSECQMQLGLVDDALATLNGVIAVDPENAEALNNLAYYMAENNRNLTIALNLADRSLNVNPDNPNAIDTKAWILFKKGDTEAALDEMEVFFRQIDIDMHADLLNADNGKEAADLLPPTINAPAISPIMGHLLVIAAKAGTVPEEALQRIARWLVENDPENKDLADYLSTLK